jgi:predicted ATPase
LADEGYGITQLISILLQIETAILSAKGKKTNNFVGLSAFDKYDYSVFHFEENTIAVEEPEIHLHPSYQSKLVEMFVDALTKYNIHFIIETHSEYLIRKLQILGASKVLNSDTISILYVYNPIEKPGYEPLVKKISIREDGVLEGTFGKGFFDEADSLSLSLLTILSEND